MSANDDFSEPESEEEAEALVFEAQQVATTACAFLKSTPNTDAYKRQRIRASTAKRIAEQDINRLNEWMRTREGAK